MSKLKAIIVDDELDAITALKWELDDYADTIEIIADFQDPVMAVEHIKKHHPDILFLDIQMPKLSGFEVLKQANGHFGQVIFITAFDEFALQAFEVSAVDYLLKPIESEKFKTTIEKIKNHNSKDHIKEQLELLINKLSKDKLIDKIAIPTMQGLRFVKPSEILYCQSESNYTMVNLLDKEQIIVSKTLKEIEKALLAHNFYRIHHSYLINLQYLSKYFKGKNAYVVLENGEQIPISRNKRNDFLNYL